MTIPFLEERWPLPPAYGLVGGPDYSVSIVPLANGYELRNLNSPQARRMYTVTIGPNQATLIEQALNWFEVVGGKAMGFRWKDYNDFQSCAPLATPSPFDQVIGTGDGTTTVFQLTKTRSVGASTRVRNISKPVAGTVLIGVAGTRELTGWTVDPTTGLVTFAAAPAEGASITAGFQFDVPLRFDVDQLPITSVDLDIVSITFNLIELRV